MANDNIGQLKTFCQLLDEEKSIIIPKVQRDYAYGRQEEKVQNVLDGMLTSIIEAVRDDSNNILDFVYGGTYVHKSDKKAGLIPLDGQQRLTTLFLLHYYASLLGDEDGNPIDQKDVEMLTKFRYETRQSATEFCTNLIRSIRPNLIKNYKPKNKNIKTLIVDDALYLSTYDSDPTIMSMLNVLDKIEKKCAELGVLSLNPCLWKRLMERRNIEFYKLSLDNFGLTDDLFIKMNARGKKLTAFEIFKSDMIAAIKKVDEKLKDDFSKDMDTKWIDIVWDYTNKTINDKRRPLDVTNDADSKYSMLFHNIFRVEYYRRNLSASGLEEQDINSILKDKEGITSVIEMFDVLYSIHKNEGFNGLWYKYFCFSEDVVGNDNLIRLFWKQKRCSVFELAMQGELSVPEVVYMYSMYLLYKKGTDKKSMKRCLRIIRNLITANVRAVDARTDKLPSFLVEVKYIVDHNGIIDTFYDKESGLNIDGNNHKLAFIQNVWNEEVAKQNYLYSESYEKLLRYENHQILQCSLSLFMDYCLKTDGLEGMKPIAPLDTTKLFELLNKFETIYSNDYHKYFHQIRTALLANDTEYMQYDAYMDDRNDKRRYFITKPTELSNFYIKYAQRRNQESILKILEEMPIPSGFLAPEELCKRFKISIRDWRYYIVNYPIQSTHQWTRYGIGVWDDFSKYPLDLILLNSSQHSKGNLEWMMMTLLLMNVLSDNEKYYLDEHGCSPISIKRSASAIQFMHGKWLIECSKDIVPVITYKFPDLSIEKTGDDMITVDFGDSNYGLDYIELGRELVKILEEVS